MLISYGLLLALWFSVQSITEYKKKVIFSSKNGHISYHGIKLPHFDQIYIIQVQTARNSDVSTQ